MSQTSLNFFLCIYFDFFTHRFVHWSHLFNFKGFNVVNKYSSVLYSLWYYVDILSTRYVVVRSECRTYSFYLLFFFFLLFITCGLGPRVSCQVCAQLHTQVWKWMWCINKHLTLPFLFRTTKIQLMLEDNRLQQEDL